jgi:hypothetical protein
MPTEREREYYRMGFNDGITYSSDSKKGIRRQQILEPEFTTLRSSKPKPKRKLSAWNKFVKANSKKKIYQYANGKLKLKKMGIAFRKKRK